MPELPQGTVTFVFTDIEGSTELLKRLGDGYGDVLTTHRRIVRDAFAAREGIEIDTQGDAFFFVFPRARDAVAAAVDVQRTHVTAAWPEGEAVRVRMGLHTGEPALHEEGYVGLDVVRAARLCTVGRGGQILVSETTRGLLGSAVPEGVSVFPLGQRQLRGIDEPERIFEVAIDGLEPVEPEPAEADEPEPAVAPPAKPPKAAKPPKPAKPAKDELERRIELRFENLGARLSSAIERKVLRSIGEETERVEGAPGDAGADDIAANLDSLGDRIEASVKAALAKKGIQDKS